MAESSGDTEIAVKREQGGAGYTKLKVTYEAHVIVVHFQLTETVQQLLDYARARLKLKAGIAVDLTNHALAIGEKGEGKTRTFLDPTKLLAFYHAGAHDIELRNRLRHVKVHFLYGSPLAFMKRVFVDESAPVKDVIDELGRSLELQPYPMLFSLRHLHNKAWMQRDVPMCEQTGGDVEMRQKYFLRILSPPLDGTRISPLLLSLLYGECVDAVLSDAWPTTLEQALALAGKQLQAEVGDYNPREHTMGSIKTKTYLPHTHASAKKVEERLWDAHKKTSGETPEEAQRAYVALCAMLPLFGNFYYANVKVLEGTGKWKDRVFGVTSERIFVAKSISAPTPLEGYALERVHHAQLGPDGLAVSIVDPPHILELRSRQADMIARHVLEYKHVAVGTVGEADAPPGAVVSSALPVMAGRVEAYKVSIHRASNKSVIVETTVHAVSIADYSAAVRYAMGSGPGLVLYVRNERGDYVPLTSLDQVKGEGLIRVMDTAEAIGHHDEHLLGAALSVDSLAPAGRARSSTHVGPKPPDMAAILAAPDDEPLGSSRNRSLSHAPPVAPPPAPVVSVSVEGELLVARPRSSSLQQKDRPDVGPAPTDRIAPAPPPSRRLRSVSAAPHPSLGPGGPVAPPRTASVTPATKPVIPSREGSRSNSPVPPPMPTFTVSDERDRSRTPEEDLIARFERLNTAKKLPEDVFMSLLYVDDESPLGAQLVQLNKLPDDEFVPKVVELHKTMESAPK